MTTRMMVRINGSEESFEPLIVGDIAETACYVGIVVAVMDADAGQYMVLVENGVFESWIRPDKQGDHIEIPTIGDLTNALARLSGYSGDSEHD